MLEGENVVIIEGNDQSGKSTLCKHLQDLSNGKCHVLHSNYSKILPKNNHRRQHKLIAKFVRKQFDRRHYTGNNLVILDRNYISDIVYGNIGYGSKGSVKSKINYLIKLLKIIKKNPTVNVVLIYCDPDKHELDKTMKDELLSTKQYHAVQKEYDRFFKIENIKNIVTTTGIKYYLYDYMIDSDFKHIDTYLENIRKEQNTHD